MASVMQNQVKGDNRERERGEHRQITNDRRPFRGSRELVKHSQLQKVQSDVIQRDQDGPSRNQLRFVLGQS
jgi:hypothetical protein